MKRKAYLLIIPLLLASCSGQRVNYDRGIIPPVPVNFSSVNSIYDDYNSYLRITWAEKWFTLIFSTNRQSSGNDFDFITYVGSIHFDLIDGTFSMDAGPRDNALLEAVNSDSNEFGPFFTRDLPYHHNWKSGGDGRFFYSSDINGSLDIFCCDYDFGEAIFQPAGDPFPLEQLNTEHDEGYLTIYSTSETNLETALFMSDHDGSYDIYRAVGEEGKMLTESSGVTVSRVTQLSSGADDKCPYVSGNMLVFASDRAGGFGGFDLWYSLYEGQEWSAPVNLGSDINTEFDEYRPVVVSAEEEGFLNDLMVFSSNRPGGKGGFDLYYVGVPRR